MCWASSTRRRTRLNGESREIVLSSHDAAWAELFEAERRRLLSVAADAIVQIHHVGSTSIPGIAAKPIIDVLVLLRRFLNEDEITSIAAPGYEYRGEQGAPGRQYFSRRIQPAFHVHCFLEENPKAQEMLLFCDYLRSHSTTAREYESLKKELRVRFRFERYSYQDGKNDFVKETLARARSSP